MDSDSSIPLRRPLRGMSPTKLLGVFDATTGEPPVVPGWEILGVAGRGGFGTVWRARREADGAIAAIKMAPPDDPDTLERIEEEAGSLRALSHPNIVALLDSGPLHENDGGLFLAMAFIDGSELSQEIPTTGMPPARAYEIFRQIVAAVVHAHDRGILHRDLKPGNILLDEHGAAHVADFGLALPVHRRIHQLSMTRAGMVAGTAEYLPPEAYLSGYRPSAAADIFALGVILHEMLTGAPPRGAWKPASTRPGVDVRIDEIIARAMDPDPANRWPDARAMLAALDEVIASPPRFSGTPLVTYPVRVMDALWTLAGLGIFLAGFASLLKLRKSRVDLPFELIGDLSPKLGAFHALFWLCLPAIPVGIWQIARLIRFRHTPMREALPSPFGLRLGHGRATAALVALAQLFCLVLPTIILLNLWLDSCMTWLKPGDPPWLHGLSVTRWDDQQLVSPWASPIGYEGFWLDETHGPPGHPLSRRIDRVGFVAFLMPLAMTLGGVAMATAMVLSPLFAGHAWWLRRRFLSLGIWFAVHALFFLPGARAIWRENRLPDLRRDVLHVNAHDVGLLKNHIAARARSLLRCQFGGASAIPADCLPHGYAETVEFRDHGPTPRDAIPSLVAAARPPRTAAKMIISSSRRKWDAATGAFSHQSTALVFYDPNPQQPMAGIHLFRLRWSGTITAAGKISIDHETLDEPFAIAADPLTATPDDAARWLDRLAVGLTRTDPASAPLESLFLPLGTPEAPARLQGQPPIGWINRLPSAGDPWLDALAREFAVNPPGRPAIVGPLPGGRTRIAIPLAPSPTPVPRILHADLVHTDGHWRCIRLAY